MDRLSGGNKFILDVCHSLPPLANCLPRKTTSDAKRDTRSMPNIARCSQSEQCVVARASTRAAVMPQ